MTGGDQIEPDTLCRDDRILLGAALDAVGREGSSGSQMPADHLGVAAPRENRRRSGGVDQGAHRRPAQARSRRGSRPGPRRGRRSPASPSRRRGWRPRSHSERAPAGSGLAVGSSRMSSPGSGARTPARARRCRSPPERRIARRPLEPRQADIGERLRHASAHRLDQRPVLEAECDVVFHAFGDELALRVLEQQPSAAIARQARSGHVPSIDQQPAAPHRAARAGRGPPARAPTCSFRSPTALRRGGTRLGGARRHRATRGSPRPHT